MTAGGEVNFAGRLLSRLGPGSCMIDAASGRTIDSDQLALLIRQYAASFAAAGLVKGDRVLIGCTVSPSSAIAYLGAIYGGFVAVPVDERMLATSQARLVEATSARAAWTEAALPALERGLSGIHWMTAQVETSDCSVGDPAAVDFSDLAVLTATSGSTGVPRFVKVTHRNLITNTEAIIRSQDLGSDERAMLILPVSYCFGASLLHTHLYQGGSIVFDRRFMFPNKVLDAADEFRCSTFAGVPTVYNVLLRRSNLEQSPLRGLRRFLQAGGPLTREKIDEIMRLFPHVKFYVMYGQTEATARISCMDPDRWLDKPGSVGRPLDNLTISIVDEEGRSVDHGKIGQLLVRGPSICPGYFNDAAETERVFADGWLRTGDLAYQDEEGFLWIEGRIGTFFKIRGTRVSAAEVETRVCAIQGIFECGATSAKHPEAGEALVLFVVLDSGSTLTAEKIRRELPAQWTIDSIRFVSELPKTSSGKIARSALASACNETLCSK